MAVLACVVFDGAAKGVRTAVWDLLAGITPLSFALDWADGGLMRP